MLQYVHLWQKKTLFIKQEWSSTITEKPQTTAVSKTGKKTVEYAFFILRSSHCENKACQPAPCQQTQLSFACLILAYSRKTLHESRKICVKHVLHIAGQGYSFEPRPNSLMLGSTGPVITIGLSINGCSHLKKTVDKREQDWIVQKFELRRLPWHEAIQAESPVLPIAQEDKRRRLLTWLLGATGIEYVLHNTGCLKWKLSVTSRVNNH